MPNSFDQLPLFQCDDQPAVIEPDRQEGFVFPKKMLMAFVTETNFNAFIAEQSAKVVGDFHTINNDYSIYACLVDGQVIGACLAPLGAPAATQIMEFLIAYGAEEIVAVGSCGVLVDTPENQLLIPTIALRDEGTSYHYLAPAATITLHHDFTQALLNYLGNQAKAVKTWTNDAYFRETPAKIKAACDQGFEVVEMECAALAACAAFRNVRFAQILFTADSLATVDHYDARGFGMASHLKTMAIGFDCLVHID
ncbi:nucleoside phosphorylase [Lacticaseibacillus porcinae]|uniref:nucleoside phosphorylase n=1 Tax=Lacticaseibacillus porcinae TaxID=1123687 RepID=UPI000F77CD3D|nr:nucleoside phosphorylase [Lacticaseibacillus porcinae]